jgi:Na+/proline symporter
MQDEKEMSLTKKIVHVVWLCVAIGLALMPSGSGDTNLLLGWVFFVWTFPFSGVWWFYLYDVTRQYMSVSVAQSIGSALVIVCAYAFWFWLIPMIWAKARTPKEFPQ